MPQVDQDFLYQRVNERVWDEGQRLAALAVQMNLAPSFIFNVRRWKRDIQRSPVPTQVLWGRKNAILSPHNGQARVAQQSQYRLGLPQLHVIPDAGHLPHQERPADVLSIVQMPVY